MTTNEYTVAGGGIAGLISAIALAEKGVRVKLLERSSHLGGRASTQHEKGFAFNRGAHALYRNGPLFQCLQRWAIPFSAQSPKLHESAYLVQAGRRFTFPIDSVRLLLTGALSLSEKLEAAAFLRKLGSDTFEPPPAITVQAWLDQESLSRQVRKVAGMLIRLSTYSNDPASFSAAAAVAQVRFGIRNGVLYVDGGWGTLIDGLVSKARQMGVRIETGTAITSVDRGTVLALPPDEIERLTGTRLPKRTPIRAACLDLGLRRLPPKSAHFGMDLDEPLYLSVHSAVARLAPDGGAMVHIVKYLQADETPDRSQLESFASLLMPGWRDETEIVRFLPNMIVSHAMPTPSGRAAVQLPGFPGVALAGDWLGSQPHQLADAAAASALEAATVVLDRSAAAA